MKISIFLLGYSVVFSVADVYHLQNDKPFIQKDFSEALMSFSFAKI